MKKFAVLGLLISALTTTTPAHATVLTIFNWHQTSRSTSIRSSYGQIAFYGSIDSIFGTSHHLVYQAWKANHGPPPATSPIQRIIFGVNGGPGVFIYPLDSSAYIAEWIILVDLYLYDNTIEGQISAYDSYSDVTMSGTPSGWIITRFGSDHPSTGCAGSPQCGGARGYWSLSVPEPTMLPIFALYAFGLLIVSRKVRSGKPALGRRLD